MNFNYEFVIFIIKIEFLIVFSIVILTVGMKLIYWIELKYTLKYKRNLEMYLTRLLHKKEQYNLKDLPYDAKQLSILIPVFLKFEKECKNAHWQLIRNDLINISIIPLARIAALRSDVPSKVLAAESFCFIENKTKLDEELILKLVNDTTPFVYLNGIRAALVYGSKNTIDALILRYAQEPWLAQSSNLKIFNSRQPEIHNIVLQILSQSKDPKIRAACYNILLHFPAEKIGNNTLIDCISKNLNLKLSALKFISHVNREQAIQILKQELQDPHWIVRLTAIDKLSDLEASESVTAIEALLNDSEWWVRLRAAKALRAFGVENKLILKAINIDPDTVEMERSALNYAWW